MLRSVFLLVVSIKNMIISKSCLENLDLIMWLKSQPFFGVKKKISKRPNEHFTSMGKKPTKTALQKPNKYCLIVYLRFSKPTPPPICKLLGKTICALTPFSVSITPLGSGQGWKKRREGLPGIFFKALQSCHNRSCNSYSRIQ